MARPVLKGAMFAIANGEKIQIGEQLDWRGSFERTGGNRSDRASLSCDSPMVEEVVE